MTTSSYLKRLGLIYLAILAATVISVTASAQTITDIDIKVVAEIQDIGPGSNIPFSNTSRIFMSDSTAHDATEADSIVWRWYRHIKMGNTWERVLLDTTFNFYPGDHIPEMCSGIQMFELEAVVSGTHWSEIFPAKCIFNSDDAAECPAIISPFTIGSFTWNDQAYFNSHWPTMLLAGEAHVPGADRITGLADLNGDGHVNVIDLLLFTSQYGQ